jgi:hypothetical protein
MAGRYFLALYFKNVGTSNFEGMLFCIGTVILL